MLRVSQNRRFLVYEDGRPFFYLSDTAWELFHRLNREEADLYLQDRARKGFTVIQAVVLAEFSGLTEPNAYGDLPLENNDPTKIKEAYFTHVNWVVERAAQLGLHIGMLPTWGDKWNKKWGQGPEIFTPENARIYGEMMGGLFGDQPIIWILGGDRPIENDRHREIIRAMARGLKAGDRGRNLMTYHPMGGRSSAEWLHDEPWLDFNMRQTGHDYNRASYSAIAQDYARSPVKPVLDGEPSYEDHPAGFKKENGYLTDYDVRKEFYWAVLAGACGHTYGCHDIWQFLSEKHPPVTFARTPWREAIHLPGSTQVGYGRRVVESRPYLTRVPDPELIASDPGAGTDHVQAARDADGSYAFVYSASGKPVRVRTGKLSGQKVAAHWFDPRDGSARRIGEFARQEKQEFMPPSSGNGNDWLLVLDDASRKRPAPSAARKG